MMLTRLLLLTAVALAALTIACSDDDDGVDEEIPPADDLVQTLEITAIDFAFEPGEFSAASGAPTEVVITNEGNAQHTFTIDEAGVDEIIGPGDQVSVTFDAPQDDAEFYCRFHSDMRGTLAIDAAGAPDTGTPTDNGANGATEDASDGATPDETDDDDDDDDDDDNSGSGSDDSGGSGYYGY